MRGDFRAGLSNRAVHCRIYGLRLMRLPIAFAACAVTLVAGLVYVMGLLLFCLATLSQRPLVNLWVELSAPRGLLNVAGTIWERVAAGLGMALGVIIGILLIPVLVIVGPVCYLALALLLLAMGGALVAAAMLPASIAALLHAAKCCTVGYEKNTLHAGEAADVAESRKGPRLSTSGAWSRVMSVVSATVIFLPQSALSRTFHKMGRALFDMCEDDSD